MKKKFLGLAAVVILLLIVLDGCSKVVTFESIVIELEGRGKFTMSNGIPRWSGNKQRFHPMEYDNGVVTGIITSERLRDWDLQQDVESPIVYKEYELKETEGLKETGKLIDPSHLEKYKMDNSKANSISIIDNNGNTIYTYSLKDESDLRSEGIEEEEFNNYFDSNGNIVKISSDYRNISDDYIALAISRYSIDGNNSISEPIKKIIVNTNTGEVFEGNLEMSKKYDNVGYLESIIVVNGEIYSIKTNGVINKIQLNNGKIIEEEFCDLGFSQDEIFMLTTYSDEHMSGENLFFTKGIVYNPTGGIHHGNSYVFNFNDKSIVDLGGIEKTQTHLEKIFPNSNGLVLINRNNYGTENRWIARYNNGSYENIQMIESYRIGSSIINYNVENILYDDKTNSFFLKRRIDNKDEGYYTYEYLTID